MCGGGSSGTTEKVGESLTRSIHSDGECGSRAVTPWPSPAVAANGYWRVVHARREVVAADSSAARARVCCLPTMTVFSMRKLPPHTRACRTPFVANYDVGSKRARTGLRIIIV